MYPQTPSVCCCCHMVPTVRRMMESNHQSALVSRHDVPDLSRSSTYN